MKIADSVPPLDILIIDGGKQRIADPCIANAQNWIAAQEAQQQVQEPTMPLTNYVFTFNGVAFRKGTDRTPVDACAIQRYHGAPSWVIWWREKTATTNGCWLYRPDEEYVCTVCGHIE